MTSSLALLIFYQAAPRTIFDLVLSLSGSHALQYLVKKKGRSLVLISSQMFQTICVCSNKHCKLVRTQVVIFLIAPPPASSKKMCSDDTGR